MKHLLPLLMIAISAFFTANTFAATLNVTTEIDPPPNGCQVNDCSLREAIIAANSQSGFHTINLPQDHYILTRGEIMINASGGISLVGEGDWQTTIDAQNLNRIFNVNHTTYLNQPSVTIKVVMRVAQYMLQIRLTKVEV